MKKISKPEISQQDVCNTFKELKYRERVLEKTEEYDEIHLQVSDLLSDEKYFILHDANYKSYMKKIYSERFSNKNYKNSYIYYREIRDSEDKCPYCSYITRQVSQLDHYLPKSIFPSLAITINNLVPICSECNSNKDNYYSINENETLLHPYYDKALDEVFNFLKCRVIEDSNIGFEFYIENLSHWDPILYNRVNKHFKLLKIDYLYCADFNADFVSCFEELKSLYEENEDIEEICTILERKVKSLFKTKIKPWAYAGFRSILESNWFLEIYLPDKFSRIN